LGRRTRSARFRRSPTRWLSSTYSLQLIYSTVIQIHAPHREKSILSIFASARQRFLSLVVCQHLTASCLWRSRETRAEERLGIENVSTRFFALPSHDRASTNHRPRAHACRLSGPAQWQANSPQFNEIRIAVQQAGDHTHRSAMRPQANFDE
jgi:hypothetical protein